MTTEAGSEELRELADGLVAALAGRSSQFVVSGTSHGQHLEFADRATEFAQYIQGALVLRDRRLFAPAFGVLRSALDHWAADLVAMLGDRFVQHYENATEEQLSDAVTRWRQGDLPSIVEEPRLVGKGRSKLRIVRRGMTSEDGSIVLHPMYFEMDSFDPFFGPPDEQPEFADWLGEPDARNHATEQRQRYNTFFRWGALVDSLILNEIVAPDHRVHLNVHHRFLSAFVHSHRAAHQLLAWNRPINGPVGHHVSDELVLLYAVQLSATYLRAFVEMTQRPPVVGVADREAVDVLVVRGLDAVDHLWLLADSPHLFDRGQELLARTATERRFESFDADDLLALEPGDVRYYRNPLSRLRQMHESSREMATGIVYVSPWA